MKAIQLSLFKPSSQLHVFCEGGYITAYDEDAMVISKVCRLSLESDIRPKVSFPLVGEFTYFPKLVRAGYSLRFL